MYICPKCNGLQTTTYRCETCSSIMDDCGRAVDYYDDYSPYLDEAITNKVDGLTSEEDEHVCKHLFYCQTCQKEKLIDIAYI
ncbi:MAG: hypothetical protein ACI35O_02390 [Bacillaceae bacterium]